MSFLNGVNSKYFFDSLIALLKNKWLPFVLGVPLFFCLHHYEGIIGDARLYLLQVIHRWQPERFVNDPPFMFGNQDSYSVFTVFYDLILSHFPIDSGTLLFTLFGHFLFLFATILFIYHFTKATWTRLWLIPLLFAFIIYSGDNMPNDHVFFWTYIEKFNASRLFSLAIAILGLGTLFAEKKYISLILFLIGTAIHPITAGWCLPLWLFLYYPKTRTLVAVFALFVPLTFLLHKGVFDIYPVDWGKCTHDHPVTYLMLWREAVATLFFGVIVPKFTKNETLLKYTKASFGVLLIGFYWSATGVAAKHIFLYQVQTWRVEWIFFVLVLPFFAYLVYEQITFIRHEKLELGRIQLTTRHASLALVGYAIFMPAPCSGVLVVSLVLLLISEKKLDLNISMLVLTALCLLSVGIQCLIENMLLGTIVFKLCNLTDLFRSVDNLIFLQFLWILGIIAAIALKIINKEGNLFMMLCFAVVLLIYAAFPQFQLLPVALFALALFYEKRIKIWLLAPILFLCIGDCFFNTELRETNVFFGFPRAVLNTAFYVFFVAIGFGVFFLNISSVLRKALLIMISSVLTIFAYVGYDKRNEELKQAEFQIELFRDNTIFSQIKDRGKMFYYVTGNYVDDSRMQFWTGSYFGETTPVGEPLFQGQFEEERKRLNYIFFKEQRGFIAKRGDWRNFVKDSLSEKKLLLDRVGFLCSINEITHFVSNLRFKELEKQDFYKMNGNETIYLYGCPNAKD